MPNDGAQATDVAQTIILVVGTLLAIATYRAAKRDRWNAASERRLQAVADRVAEVGAAIGGLGWSNNPVTERARLIEAQLRLRTALIFTMGDAELPTCDDLATANVGSLERRRDVLVLAAASEVADAIRALPEGAWIVPLPIKRLWWSRDEWRRRASGMAWRLRRMLRRRPKRDDDDEIVEA